MTSQPNGKITERVVGTYCLIAIYRTRAMHHDHKRERPFSGRIDKRRGQAPHPSYHSVCALSKPVGQSRAECQFFFTASGGTICMPSIRPLALNTMSMAISPRSNCSIDTYAGVPMIVCCSHAP